MANLLSNFLNGSGSFIYNNGSNVVPSYTLVQPTFANTSSGASIFNQTFGTNSFGNSLLFGSSLGGTTLTGGFGNSFNVGGFNTSFNFGAFGNGFGFGTTTGTTTIPTSTGTTIATKQVAEDSDEDSPLTFATSDFAYSNGDAVASMKISDLPDYGTLELNGVTVSVNQIIDVGDFDDLTYYPDPNFDGSETFSVLLSSDGVTYDTRDSNVVIDILASNDTPTIGSVTTQTVTEGSTATGLGSAIVAAFEDVDSDDELGAVYITDIDDETLGTLQYTTADGGTVTITDDEADSGDGYELTAEEAETLVFVADQDTIDDDDSGTNKVTIEFTMEDSNGGLSTDSSTGETGSVAIQVYDGDDDPDFSDSGYDAVIEVNENDTSFGEVNPATDDDSNNRLTYSITGTDASHFTVDANNGSLSFSEAPDYEDPQDRNSVNEYTFVLHAQDESGNSASTTVNVSVQDVEAESSDWGLTASSAIIDEETTIAMTVVPDLYDTSNEVTLSIGSASTKQNDLFEIDSNGVLSFITEPDAENPDTGVTNGVYKVDVVLTDEDEIDSDDDEPLAAKTVEVTVTVKDIHDAEPALVASSPISDVSTANIEVGAVTGSLSFEFSENIDTSAGDINLISLKFQNGEYSDLLNNSPDLSFSLESTADTDTAVDDFVLSTLSTPGSSAVTATISMSKDSEFDFESLDDDGEFQLSLIVTDNDDDTTAETVIDVKVTNVNEKPELMAVPDDLRVLEGDKVEFGEEAIESVEDPEESDLLFELVSATATFDGESAMITFNGPSSPVTYSSDYNDENVDFLIFYEAGTLVEYSGQYLTRSQAETLTLDADFGDATLASNPLVSLKFSVDDDFSENTNPTGADPLTFTTYVGVDAGL